MGSEQGLPPPEAAGRSTLWRPLTRQRQGAQTALPLTALAFPCGVVFGMS